MNTTDDVHGNAVGGGPAQGRPFRRIVAMLESASSEERSFPPTLLYNEGWLLRLVLDWFSTTGTQGHSLSFAPGARWFSEARLASRYMSRAGRPASRSFAEGYTHADGVIGHFELGSLDRSDALLSSTAQQFVVTEAKLGSALSIGTKNAPEFDQAARNVACMAHLCSRHLKRPEQLERCAFLVLAPQVRIKEGVFETQLARQGLLQKVLRREAGFPPEVPDDWAERWFVPLLADMTIEAISWESVIEFVGEHEPMYARELVHFYERCRRFNYISDETTLT